MIAFLKGHIEEKSEGKVLLDVQGVGYGVEVSSQTLESMEALGSEIKLLIYHHITDNDQRLFGFISLEEKALFEKLITVKGVGPKLGLTILSGLPANHLITAIASGDIATLSRVPGIGKKTAERISLELKEKLPAPSSTGGGTASSESNGQVMKETIQALVALGFSERQSEQAVIEVLKVGPGSDVSTAIRRSLAILNR